MNAGGNDGLAILSETATPLYAIGIFVGLLVWSLGVWFTFLAVATLIIQRRNGTIGFVSADQP